MVVLFLYIGCADKEINDSPTNVPVYIQNNIGMDILYGGYVRQPGTVIWDSLFATVITADSLQIAVIPASVIDGLGKVDLQLRCENEIDGVWYTKLDYAITPRGTITFGASDFDTASSRLPINIQNNTSVGFHCGFVRQPSTTSWESLSAVNIPSGSNRSVIIPLSHISDQGRADIQLRTAETDGAIFTKQNQNITANGSIIFVGSDFDNASSQLPVTIQNNTGYGISFGFIRYPSTTEWEHIFTAEVSDSSTHSLLIPRIYMDAQNMVDLQVRTDGGVLYHRRNQNITPNITIFFIPTNLDYMGPRPVMIVNNTNIDIDEVYAKPFDNRLWTYIGAGISSGGFRRVGIPISAISAGSTACIQLRVSNTGGICYTKDDIYLNINDTVTFTERDFSSATRVNIVNNTGMTVINGYVRSTVETHWTNLFAESMQDETTLPAIISANHIDANNKSDLQLKSSSGQLYTILGRTITENGSIRFTPQDIDSRPLTIVNDTGELINILNVRRPGSTSWSGNLLTTNISETSGSSQILYIALQYFDSDYKVDIQLRSSSATYLKTDQTINYNGSISFSQSDRTTLPVTIVNNTGAYINMVYVKLPGTADWVAILNNFTMNNGTQRILIISAGYLDSQGYTDIQLHASTTDRTWYTKLNQPIYVGATISFTPADIDTQSPAPMIIKNSTGVSISGIYVKSPVADSWSYTLTPITLQNDATHSINIPANCRDSANRVDIQLRRGDTIIYAKNRQTITVNDTLSFTASDLAPDSPIPVFIQNNTLTDSYFSMYAKKPGTTIWSIILENSGYTTASQSPLLISVPRSAIDSNGMTDLRLMSRSTTDQVYYTRQNQSITVNGTITFISADIDPQSSIPVRVQNNTNTTAISVSAGLPGTSTWNSINTSILSNNPPTYVVTIPFSLINSQGRVNIRLSGRPYIYDYTFIKLDEYINFDTVIIFIDSDLDTTSSIPISVLNNTGNIIRYTGMRRTNNIEWSNVATSPQSISNGSRYTISIPFSILDSQNEVDLMVLTIGDIQYTKLHQIISYNATITFTASDLDAENSSTPVNILNNIGVDISSVYARSPGTENWGYALSNSSIASGNTASVGIPASAINAQNMADLRLMTSGGVTYVRLNQTIIANGTITFTAGDLDPSIRVVTLQNNTGEGGTVRLYAKTPSATSWGELFPYTSLVNGGQRLIGIPLSAIDNEGRSDLRMSFDYNYYFTRLNQTITSNGTITFLPSNLDPASPRRVTIVNNTGSHINSIYVKVAGTTNWGYGSGSISNGSSTTINIYPSSLDAQGYADLQLRTIGDVRYTKTNQYITHNGSITFIASDLDPATRPVTIQNNSGVLISYCLVKLPGATNWISIYSNTSSGIPNGNSIVMGIPAEMIDNQDRADLQLRTRGANDTGGVYFTRLNQIATTNGTIIFQATDLDATGPRPVVIENLTGRSLETVYARQVGTTNWSPIYSQSIYIYNSAVVGIPLSLINQQGTVDLQVRSYVSAGVYVYYTKLNQAISQFGTVTFLESDITP